MNLESSKLQKRPLPIALANDRLTPNLQGVEVCILGADNAGKPLSHWPGLHDFWAEYLQQTGAQLKTYSATRLIWSEDILPDSTST